MRLRDSLDEGELSETYLFVPVLASDRNNRSAREFVLNATSEESSTTRSVASTGHVAGRLSWSRGRRNEYDQGRIRMKECQRLDESRRVSELSRLALERSESSALARGSQDRAYLGDRESAIVLIECDGGDLCALSRLQDCDDRVSRVRGRVSGARLGCRRSRGRIRTTRRTKRGHIERNETEVVNGKGKEMRNSARSPSSTPASRLPTRSLSVAIVSNVDEPDRDLEWSD